MEYVDNARQSIMYANLTSINRHKFLVYIVLAVVDIRLRNRIQLPWIEKCVVFPCKLTPTLEHFAWPVLVVVGKHVYSVHKNQVVHHSNCIQAFMTWHNMCIERCEGVIDGRWNVRDYTI